MLGFETIGNATIPAFDDTPVITTDPWIKCLLFSKKY